MMTVWLHVGQPDNVPAQDDGGHQPALRLGTTAVTQAWAKLHIFKYECVVNRMIPLEPASAALSWSEQDELKVDVKPQRTLECLLKLMVQVSVMHSAHCVSQKQMGI